MQLLRRPCTTSKYLARYSMFLSILRLCVLHTGITLTQVLYLVRGVKPLVKEGLYFSGYKEDRREGGITTDFESFEVSEFEMWEKIVATLSSANLGYVRETLVARIQYCAMIEVSRPSSINVAQLSRATCPPVISFGCKFFFPSGVKVTSSWK